MTGRRKGTPCACETDPCSCGSSGRNCIRAINNLSPDANGDFVIEAGSGILITQTGDNSFEVSFDGTFPSNPLIYKGTVGSGGTVAVLPAADPDNIGWMYIAIEDGTVPVTYASGDTLISNGYTWVVIPSGDDPVDWSQILNKPDTIAGYGITDAYTKAEVDAIDDTKLDKLTGSSGFRRAYTHLGATQGDVDIVTSPFPHTILIRDQYGRGEVADAPSGATDNTAVNTNWVSQTGNSAPNNLIHRTGNETVSGAKTNIGSEIVNGIWANKSVIMQFTSDNTAYRKIYEFNDTSGAQYTTIAFLVTNRRIQNNRIGLLIAGNNRSSSPRLTWMIKSNDIGLTEFVITKENDGTVTLWCKQYGGDADGYHFTRLMENSTGAPVSRWEASQDTNAYNITSSGYTDSNGVTHTFDYYVNSVMIA